MLETVGMPILIVSYDEGGRAGLEFKDRQGIYHYISPPPISLEPGKDPPGLGYLDGGQPLCEPSLI